MTSATRKRLLASIGAVAAVALLAACSSGNGSGSSSSATTTATQTVTATTTATATASSSASANSGKTLQIAYLSFAVNNTYDTPMLAAAQAVASDENAKLTVFDANNDPNAQFSQFQDAINSGKYDGIITQPILNTNLLSLVAQAISKGIKVVNIDQILGKSYTTDAPQASGLSGNVVFVPSKIGTQMGQEAVKACASKHLNPCNVGYMYDIKASTLDVAIRNAFNTAIKGSPVKVIAEGQDFFTPAMGLTAAQDMLTAHSNLNMIVASDQGLEGTTQALSAAKKTNLLMVGFGASAAGLSYVKNGSVFADVAQAPASEGRIGVQSLIAAIRTGKNAGGIDPVAALPDDGIVTKANVAKFTAEWNG